MENNLNKPLGKSSDLFRWRRIVGIMLIIFGIQHIYQCFKGSTLIDPNNLFAIYIFIAGGIRTMLSSKDDKIKIWKKFLMIFALYWIVRTPICYIESLIFGEPICWIGNITFILIIELGLSNRLIVYIEEKIKQVYKSHN